MSRPEITISEDRIEVVSERYRLTVEFPIYVNPVAVALWGKRFEDAKQTCNNPGEIENETAKITKNKSAKKASKQQRFHDYMNKPIRNYKPRECKFCGKTFDPVGATHRFCSDKCKALSKRKKPLSEMEEAELDKTMAEIEARRKNTYKID